MYSPEQTWAPSPEAVFSTVGEEVVLLHLGSGIYFGLDAIGAQVWDLLGKGENFAAIVQAIADAYGKAAEEISGDIAALLDDLFSHELIAERAES